MHNAVSATAQTAVIHLHEERQAVCHDLWVTVLTKQCLHMLQHSLVFDNFRVHVPDLQYTHHCCTPDIRVPIIQANSHRGHLAAGTKGRNTHKVYCSAGIPAVCTGNCTFMGL